MTLLLDHLEIGQFVELLPGGPLELEPGERVVIRWYTPEQIGVPFEALGGPDPGLLVGGPLHRLTPIRTVKLGMHNGRGWVASLDLSVDFIRDSGLEIFGYLEAEFRQILAALIDNQEELDDLETQTPL